MRASRRVYNPIFNDQGDVADFKSCFVTNGGIVASNNHLYVLTFNLGKPMIQNTVLIVQDFYEGLSLGHTT